MRKQLDASLTEKEKGSNTDSDISGLDRKGQGGTKHEERHEWQSGQQPFSPTQCVDAPHSWQGTQKVDGACRATVCHWNDFGVHITAGAVEEVS